MTFIYSRNNRYTRSRNPAYHHQQPSASQLSRPQESGPAADNGQYAVLEPPGTMGQQQEEEEGGEGEEGGGGGGGEMAATYEVPSYLQQEGPEYSVIQQKGGSQYHDDYSQPEEVRQGPAHASCSQG